MSIYDITGTEIVACFSAIGEPIDYAYDANGNLIFSKEEPVQKRHNYDDYTITDLFTYGRTSSQGFAVYNGAIAQINTAGFLYLIDIDSQSEIRKITMDVGHGNSCQFSDEFYSQNDELPLFYERNSGGVCVYRITGTSSALLKKYTFSADIIGTYVASFGVDSVNRRFYSVSYTEGDYTTKTGLLRVCVWDMDSEIDNGDGTYSMTLLRSNDLTWFDKYQAVQGGCYHKDYLFISAGQSSQHVVLIDPTTLTIQHDITVPGSEIEGCAWVDDDYMIVGQNPSNIAYKKIEFAEL